MELQPNLGKLNLMHLEMHSEQHELAPIQMDKLPAQIKQLMIHEFSASIVVESLLKKALRDILSFANEKRMKTRLRI